MYKVWMLYAIIGYVEWCMMFHDILCSIMCNGMYATVSMHNMLYLQYVNKITKKAGTSAWRGNFPSESLWFYEDCILSSSILSSSVYVCMCFCPTILGLIFPSLWGHICPSLWGPICHAFLGRMCPALWGPRRIS